MRVLVDLDCRGQLMQSIELRLKEWSNCYRSKHAHQLSWPLNGTTFYLGRSNHRLHWFILMQPQNANAFKWHENPAKRASQVEAGCKQSALEKEHAEALFLYIKELFKHPELSGSGFDQEMSFTNMNSTLQLNHRAWVTFQRLFMEMFAEGFYSDPLGEEPATWWDNYKPAFACYDYGQDEPLDPPMGIDMMEWISEELDRHFDSANIASICVAIAQNFNYDSEIPDVRQPSNGFGNMGILMECKHVESLFETPRERRALSLYRLGLQGRYCNWQSSRPPTALANLFQELNGYLAEVNGSRHEIANMGHVQGYSMIKQVVRHDPMDFKIAKGMYTGALGYPISKTLDRVAFMREKDKVWKKVGLSAEREERPLNLTRKCLQTAADTGRIGFRIEGVICVKMSRLRQENRNFHYICDEVLLPYLTWWASKGGGLDIVDGLVVFPKSDFPGILITWTRILELLMGRFIATYLRFGGLTVLEAEIVANTERAAVFVLTGDVRLV
ncbi:hypothetical protein BDZ91DRAFT_792565 [Kalaharituber pfeilii]|nr:hypothetical protein BDZ91DRAFT_792565 [Kalaharituber pfeilii]